MTDSTRVVRLFGGPGSGKTTALLDRVEQLLEDDDVVAARRDLSGEARSGGPRAHDDEVVHVRREGRERANILRWRFPHMIENFAYPVVRRPGIG